MLRRSTKIARLFGLIMILLVSAWDMDAMRPHIAAHSWYTLALVGLFLVVHLLDYLTVGQLVTHVDSLAMADVDLMTRAIHQVHQQEERIGIARILPQQPAARFSWRRLFPLRRSQPSLNLSQPTAKLYTFTAVTTTVAQVSGAPYSIARQHFIVEPE